MIVQRDVMPTMMYSARSRMGSLKDISPNRAVYYDSGLSITMPQSMGDVWCLNNAARSCRNLEGDIAEAGVYYGSTARLLMRFFDGTNKTIHLFDTFDTMPPAGENDIAEYWHPKTGLSVERVLALLQDYNRAGLVRTYKGLFKDTLHNVNDKKFCFVHIDCDLYGGCRDALEFFYPRVVQGGAILIHDYDTTAFPGILKAVDEFFAYKSDLRVSNRYGFHHVVVKR